MKIKLISTSADYGKLKEEYIKAFNAKESKTGDDYGNQIYTYEVFISFKNQNHILNWGSF